MLINNFKMNPKNILDILNRDLSEFKDETPVFQSEMIWQAKLKVSFLLSS